MLDQLYVKYMFDTALVYSSGLLLAGAVLLAVLIALCGSLHRSGAFAETPRRIIRQFSFSPRNAFSPRAYEHRRGF